MRRYEIVIVIRFAQPPDASCNGAENAVETHELGRDKIIIAGPHFAAPDVVRPASAQSTHRLGAGDWIASRRG